MEEPEEDDDQCPICGRSVFAEGAPYFVEVSESDSWIDEGFCSWEHVSAWVLRGKPEFERPVIQEYRESLFERVTDVLVPVAITAWTLFSGYAVFVLLR